MGIKWESIEDVLTPKGIEDLDKRLKAGEKPILTFDFEGSKTDLRIRRITKGRVWAERTHLYTEEEMRQEVQVENRVRPNKNRKS